MTHLKDKIVLITGASSGIGAAAAKKFAANGCHLILIARRLKKLEVLAKNLQDNYHIKCFIINIDIQNREKVLEKIATLPNEWRYIDILINNAGLALTTLPMQENSLENWETMLNTNIHGFLFILHAILKIMVERKSGHIINIGSIAGRHTYPGGNIYCGTKHFVRSISESLRIDLLGKNIRVTEIAPAAVNTEFSTVRFQDKEKADAFYKDFRYLTANDIADTILYCASCPLHVNISEIVIYSIDQASPTAFYRQENNNK